MLTVTSLSTAVTSLLFFVGGIRIYFSWRKEKSNLLKFFAIFLIAFGFQQLFFSLGAGVVSLDAKVNGWFWWIAHIFMFVGISYFIRFPLSIRLVRFEKIIFNIAKVYSVIGSIILFLNLPNVDSYLMENGIYIFVVPAMSGAVIGIFTTICLSILSSISSAAFSVKVTAKISSGLAFFSEIKWAIR